MPSPIHELVLRLLRESPSLVRDLLAHRVVLPDDPSPIVVDPQLSPANAPSIHAPDVVLRFRRDECESIVAAEVQLAVDDRKRWTWPYYVAFVGARERCPVWLAVFTLDDSVARWARQPITWLHGLDFVPIVVGPDDIPRVTDPDVAAQSPELALLSALVAIRREGDAAEPVVLSLFAAAATLDPERLRFYTDLTWEQLKLHAPSLLEKLMRPPPGYQYQSEPAKHFIALGREEGREEGREVGREEGREEGRAAGEAHLLTRLLERKFGTLSVDTRERIVRASLADLDRWADRIFVANRVDDIFES